MFCSLALSCRHTCDLTFRFVNVGLFFFCFEIFSTSSPREHRFSAKDSPNAKSENWAQDDKHRGHVWRKKHFAGVSLSTSAVDPWEIRRSYRLLFNLRLLQHSGGPTTAAVVGALRDTTRVLIRRPVQAQILWSSSIFINPTSISVFYSPRCAL